MGFVFFVYDGTKSIAGNAIFYTPLSDTWNSVHAASLAAAAAGHRAALPEGSMWDQFSPWVLAAPTFAVFGVIGAVLVLIGRKKQPLIGYDR